MIAVKYVYLSTIGCQMNVYDSERMVRELAGRGYVTTPVLEKADLVLVNTCTIRAKAEQKAFSFLGRLRRLKHQKPALVVGVGGCVAQQEGEKILRRMPWVDLVFGPQAIGRLPGHVQRIEAQGGPVVDIDLTAAAPEEKRPSTQGAGDGVTRFVTIMRGCDNFCSYCVVPHVRGREASRHPDDILDEIRGLVASGVREVTLLGQNVNSYGQKEGLCAFPELLARIDALDGLWRIRFTTSHPKDLSDELIGAFGRLGKLCRHIHLPVQSGSDRVLSRMNRKYSRQHYLARIANLRQACPDIAISTDIIVGFPGETREDFNETLSLIKTVEYDSLFAFQYSDRPQVPAARFADKVPLQDGADRLQELLGLQERYTLRNNQRLVGGCEPILVEGLSKKQDRRRPAFPNQPPQWTGRTTSNKIVNFLPAEADSIPGAALTGKMVAVRIEKALAHSLRGTQVQPTAAPSAVKGDANHAA
jgi:tRNA-2-methylthio-N6-dimethylallyladenosine synthase